jgi:hypothetical protein
MKSRLVASGCNGRARSKRKAVLHSPALRPFSSSCSLNFIVRRADKDGGEEEETKLESGHEVGEGKERQNSGSEGPAEIDTGDASRRVD